MHLGTCLDEVVLQGGVLCVLEYLDLVVIRVEESISSCDD